MNDWPHFVPRPMIILRLLRLSVGGILQILIGTSSWVVLVAIIGGCEDTITNVSTDTAEVGADVVAAECHLEA